MQPYVDFVIRNPFLFRLETIANLRGIKGIWSLENFLTGISAGSLAVFTRPKSEGGLGWSKEEVEVLLAGVRKDLKNTDIHAYLRV